MISRRWKRYGINHLAISRGVFIKINDGQKIRSFVGLVARPDVQHRVSLSVRMLCESVWYARQSENQSQ